MASGIFSRAMAVAMLAALSAVPALADETGFASTHDWRREGGRTCFSDHYHYGSGSGGSKAAAQRSAISSWISFTDFEYGSDWARWGRAAGKRMSCSQSSSGYDCQVEARPCR